MITVRLVFSWFGLVWLYAAGTTVTHGAPTGDTHPHPTKNNTTAEHTKYDNPNTG